MAGIENRAHSRSGGERRGRALGGCPLPSLPLPSPPGFRCLSCSPELLNLVISVVVGGGLAEALGGDGGSWESRTAN